MAVDEPLMECTVEPIEPYDVGAKREAEIPLKSQRR